MVSTQIAEYLEQSQEQPASAPGCHVFTIVDDKHSTNGSIWNGEPHRMPPD